MRALLIGILSTGVAHAGLFDPIDVTKQADDVNGKKVHMPAVDMPQLHYDNVPKQMRPGQSAASESGKTANRGTNVETKQVNFDTLQFSRVPTETVPHQNFSTKRAVVNSAPISEPVVAQKSADVTDHRIRPFTKAGQTELGEQLRKNP